MIRVSSLASGSKGNSLLIDGPEGALAVDAGLSARELVRRMEIVGVDPGRLRAILVTHDHSDHLRGVRVLAKRLGIPVYATRDTLAAAHLPPGIREIPITPGIPFDAAGFSVVPFPLPHDAADPVGYVVQGYGIRMGVATDLGSVNALVRERLTGCDMLLLEFNYEERMLLDGPYPWFLKQRIQGRLGHLSNDHSARFLSELIHTDLQHVILGHLSEVNNCPDRALAAAETVAGYGNGTRLTVGRQAEPTPIIVLEP
ncbi:MAG: MBL fold metallo-hydrolase [bacterium]|nr:MBL fold metallo-hydrolase [bacterium]MDT8395506.1 MBL fold metallo-hydrolase [bacterium]